MYSGVMIMYTTDKLCPHICMFVWKTYLQHFNML